MAHYTTIVWDWNGTLLDDTGLCLEVNNRLLQKYGKKPVSGLEVYRELFGFPVQDFYVRLGFDFEETPFSLLAAEYMDDYQPASRSCLLQPGAEEVLRAIAGMGIGQVLLSASRLDLLREQLACAPIRGCFSAVLGTGDIYAQSKLELARGWLAAHGTAPEEVLFIGDTLHDAEVAAALGTSCVLFTGGHQSRERLSSTGLPLISELLALPALL